MEIEHYCVSCGELWDGEDPSWWIEKDDSGDAVIDDVMCYVCGMRDLMCDPRLQG
jgi:hypothetical protein